MNIFFTSYSPLYCADALDDKRLNKMILETGQLLSSAIHHFISTGDDRLTDKQKQVLYKPTHFNHPSAKFARHNFRTYSWLVKHFNALANERFNRTGKQHLTYEKLFEIVELYEVDNWDCLTESLVRQFMACGDDLKASHDPFEAYRKHMIRKWINDEKPTWTKTYPPRWAEKFVPHAVTKEK